MASSSSSYQQNQRSNAFSGIEPDSKRRKVSESSRRYDVFINHRGSDVKLTLATQLYKSLKDVGIRAFLDSEEKKLGELFTSTIETAIRSAKVHIAIFSKRYAESPWCLAELALMLQTQANIIPVFYQVKPSDLRYIETGEYANAFAEFENKRRYLEKLPEWKEALQYMSFVAGEEFNGDCKNIIAEVQKEVQTKTHLHVAKYPVGLDNLVQDCLDELVLDFENQSGFEAGKCAAGVVGIFGMGGSGKTTLAKELFNRTRSNYCRASFLFDVREAHVTGRLPSLQGQLLKDLFEDQTLNPTSTEKGMNHLKDHLQRSPNVSCLIVVDDIDRVEQLNALMIMDIVVKFCNTLIIVTTRDVGVLIRAGITDHYNLKGLDRNNGRELFCWHAFNQSRSSNGFERLVEDFVNVCGGLPLSLQVLGRHVHGKPYSFWSSALIQARKRLPEDVKHTLKISFDSLSGEEKQIFMDIACFFIRKLKCIAERVWEGSGWNAQHSLEILKDKCLVEERNDSWGMHDHLRDLGREMALELGSPLRLWRPQDLQYLESMGLKNILAKKDLRCFHSMFDESMRCKVKFFVGQPDICVERLTSVLWLGLKGPFKLDSIPSWISLRYVQCLNIRFGELKTLWENRIQAPSQLKELQIGFCRDLEELSLGHLSCLEKISIEQCSQLKSVSGINDLPKLVDLQIYDCGKVEFECLRLSGMRFLEKIELDTEVMVKHFEVDNCQNLKSINYGCKNMARCGSQKSLVFENPVCLVRVIINGCGEFKCLRVINCQNLKTVLGNLKIRELEVRDCPEIEELPNFSRLSSMQRIHIASCRKLENIVLPTSLTSLSLIGCKNLRRVSTTGDLKMLTEFYIKDCPEVEELPNFSRLSSMEKIHIASCGKLENIVLPTSLTSLSLKSCSDLRRVPNFSRLSSMEKIHIASCGKLENIVLPTSLTSLSLKSCSDLRRVSTTSDLKMLTEFYIEDCPEFEELPTFSSLSSIQRIHIESCRKLENIVLPRRLFLKELVIDSCEKLIMANIDELHVEEDMRLFRCSKALIRNCIDKLKNVPWESIVIGRAVEGAESSLNECLFSDPHTVTDICKFDMCKFWMRFPKWEGLGLMPILCCVYLFYFASWRMDNYNNRT